MKFPCVCLFLFVSVCNSLDNGLARTPPMGWLAWERFRCHTDCQYDPLNCISEKLFRSMADELVTKGFKDVGYEYIIMDDCWLDKTRGPNGTLRPDPDRFPSGIKALADYVHSLGLKFGIYEDFGSKTCAGYPGLLRHLEQDAKTFADWGVDYVKVDGCNVDYHKMPKGFKDFGHYLNQTGRPIVYSCEWPLYWKAGTPDYQSISETCNLWRNHDDINDDWKDVVEKIDFYGDDKGDFAKWAGPGGWNDPDMLIIGNFALSPGQAKVQMAMWSIFASPLLMSNDLRTISTEYQNILKNKGAIKINQDPLGIQGKRVYKNKKRKLDIFVKPILPSYHGNHSAAVGIFYRGTGGTPARVTISAHQMGLKNPGGYRVTEVFEETDMGDVTTRQKIKVKVNPVGITFLRFDVKPVRHHQGMPVQDFNDHQEEGIAEEDDILVEDLGKVGWESKPSADTAKNTAGDIVDELLPHISLI